MSFGAKCRNIKNTESTVYFRNDKCVDFEFKKAPYIVFLSPGIYLFELYGASGGYGSSATTANPGKGGYAKGLIKLNKKQLFYLFIGGMGGNRSISPESAGYNGGAPGSNGPDSGITGGSGGATDIRLEEDKLESRIIVAGGGGSAGDWKYAGKGGDGGGIEGEHGNPSTSSCSVEGGAPGTQIGGYEPGQGSSGQNGGSNKGEAGGAGGGGYWGGIGGKTGGNACSSGGGGGGSSFISGHKNCTVIDKDRNSLGTSFHPSGFYFNFPSTESGVNVGNGRAIISLMNYLMASCKIKSRSAYLLNFLLYIIVSK